MAALMALPATASITVARLQPDDVIVVESDERLTVEGAERLKAHVQQVWPDHRVAVFDKGYRMKVVRG